MKKQHLWTMVTVIGVVALTMALFLAACDDSNSADDGTGFGTGTGPGNGTSIEMVYVPGGSFEMGKVHTVTLSGFYMGKYEVTQEQYQAVMGSNPSYYHGGTGREPASGEVQGKRPVEGVSWYDAIEFCNALSTKEGLSPYYTVNKSQADPNNTNEYDNIKWTVTRNSTANGYRLPTEAQWEYAARGGNGSPGNYTFAGSNTVGDVAWNYFNSSSKTHEVGKKSPNGLGIYDMSGNVCEWCWDWYGAAYQNGVQTDPAGAASGLFRVFRGGGCNRYDQFVTSSVNRDFAPSPGSSNYIGFRLVRP